jgi:hypothetical protein
MVGICSFNRSPYKIKKAGKESPVEIGGIIWIKAMEINMHIAEGVLSPPVLIAGAVLSSGGIAIGLSRIKGEDIPKVAMLSSAFFVASLIHIPFGPTSAHLVLMDL